MLLNTILLDEYVHKSMSAVYVVKYDVGLGNRYVHIYRIKPQSTCYWRQCFTLKLE